ncbi:MAG: aconitase X catalytic domain-containing protein [Candidatus Methylarchaceae archaeon HK01B]|nr:aconitase X catalytic domain-containing protein [Candidatus Methylarchaceae archaeon HK02M1]MCP8319158.1 aconitase X catalytic domain-containing protein [Candidatus Methylarchaceae archaeon HK01B]
MIYLYLTNYEERALDGEYGEALEMAYRILLSVGRLTDASHLIEISSAHLSGVSYSTIGEHGREFLEGFSLNAKVTIPTTVNPAGIDPKNPSNFNIHEDYILEQMKIVRSYKKLGVAESFTCTPYEVVHPPPKGGHVSWAESSASIYANSILDLRTNRESALSALASAVTGKTPYSELHIEEFRKPSLSILVDTHELSGSMKFGLLGYFAGKMARGPMALQGIKSPTSSEAKALCAAIGTSGAAGMFLIKDKVDVEGVKFDRGDLEKTYDELNDAEEGDVIVLGCPHLGLNEIHDISDSVEGKKFNKRCLLFCSGRVYEEAKLKGYADKIEGAGADFICNTCAVFTPIISHLEVDVITTNSCKAAHYLKRTQNVKVSLKETHEMLKEVCG